MKTLKQATILGLLITFICVSTVFADVKLPHVLGSNMVLQRDMPVPVWGWADAREQVTITLGDQEATTTADADGNWRVTLPMMAAGGPHKITVSGSEYD